MLIALGLPSIGTFRLKRPASGVVSESRRSERARRSFGAFAVTAPRRIAACRPQPDDTTRRRHDVNASSLRRIASHCRRRASAVQERGSGRSRAVRSLQAARDLPDPHSCDSGRLRPGAASGAEPLIHPCGAGSGWTSQTDARSTPGQVITSLSSCRRVVLARTPARSATVIPRQRDSGCRRDRGSISRRNYSISPDQVSCRGCGHSTTVSEAHGRYHPRPMSKTDRPQSPSASCTLPLIETHRCCRADSGSRRTARFGFSRSARSPLGNAASRQRGRTTARRAPA